jgi:chromosome segregation ATPase
MLIHDAEKRISVTEVLDYMKNKFKICPSQADKFCENCEKYKTSLESCEKVKEFQADDNKAIEEARLKTQVGELNKKILELTDQTKKLKTSYESLKKENEFLANHKNASEEAHLKSQVEELNYRSLELTDQTKKLKTSREVLKKENEFQANEIQRKESEVAKLRFHIQELNQRIFEITNETEKLKINKADSYIVKMNRAPQETSFVIPNELREYYLIIKKINT